MSIRVDKWLVVLIVAGLATLSWWLPVEQGPVSKLVIAPVKRHIPDYYLGDFDLTTMNAAGRPRYNLQAGGMSHYIDDDTSRVAQPRLTVYRRGAAPWLVSARQAQVAAGAESVLLQGDVKVRRPAQEGRSGPEIDTSVLRVVPGKEYAETDQPVLITADFGATRAVGMQADLKQRQLRLLAQVRGDYARK